MDAIRNEIPANLDPAPSSRAHGAQWRGRGHPSHHHDAAPQAITRIFHPSHDPFRPEPHSSRRSHTPGRRPGPSAHNPSDGSVTSSPTTGATPPAPVARSRQQPHGHPHGVRHPDPSDGSVTESQSRPQPGPSWQCGVPPGADPPDGSVEEPRSRPQQGPSWLRGAPPGADPSDGSVEEPRSRPQVLSRVLRGCAAPSRVPQAHRPFLSGIFAGLVAPFPLPPTAAPKSSRSALRGARRG